MSEIRAVTTVWAIYTDATSLENWTGNWWNIFLNLLFIIIFFLFGFLFHQEELQPLDPSPSGFKMVINDDVSEDVSNWRIELTFSKAINIGRFNIYKAFVEPHSEQADSVCLRPRQHNKVLGSGEKLRLEFVCEYGEHGKDQEAPTGNFKFLPDATECDGGASTSGEFSLNKTATYLYFEENHEFKTYFENIQKRDGWTTRINWNLKNNIAWKSLLVEGLSFSVADANLILNSYLSL